MDALLLFAAVGVAAVVVPETETAPVDNGK